MRRRMTWKNFSAIAIASFLTLIFCSSVFAKLPAQTPRVENPLLQAIKQTSTSTKQSAKVGKFAFGYDQPIDAEDGAVQALLQSSGVFENHVNRLAQIGFNLPDDLPIHWKSCRNIPEMKNSPANAFYHPQTRDITLCYEFFKLNEQLFVKNQLPVEDAKAQALGISLFTMYHELGHALIDFLDIPITGKEEDAVDDFAAYMLLDTDNPHPINVVLAAANGFNLMGTFSRQTLQQHGLEASLYWDEHSLGEQRFTNLVCIIYGSHPEQYAGLASQVGLPEHRAARCPGEYQQKVASWTKLIVPHLYEQQGTWEASPSPSNSSSSEPSSPTPEVEVPQGAWGD